MTSNLKRVSLVALLVAGMSGLASTAITATMDSADFTWKYEFDADLPTVSDLDGNGTGDFNEYVNGGTITLSDDVLTISCPEKSNVAYYYCGWGAGSKIWDVIDDLDLEHGVTVEMSVKVDDVAAEGSQGATALGAMPDGTNVDAKLYIGKTSQWWGEENYSNFQELPSGGTIDNTDGFHAFRLALDPTTDTYSVWRDTELLGSGLGDTDSRDGLRRLVFGTYASSLSWGDAEIDYVRFTSGAYAPEAPDLLPGDANGDGFVDVSDLGILATNYDQGGGFGWEHADFTGDGYVDVSDLGILATNYGATPDAQSVPEPSTLGLLLLGALTLLRRRRG